MILVLTNRCRSKNTIDAWGSKILTGLAELAHNVESCGSAKAGPARHQNLLLPGMIHSESSASTFQGLVGTRCVLSWAIFSNKQLSTPALISKSTYMTVQRKSGSESATTDPIPLTSLAHEFANTYKRELSFLDAEEIDSCIQEIAENGPSWNSRSCFVFLISAITWISRSLPESHEMASRYWNMARKRLSWALEGDDVVSVQCILLMR